MKKYLFYILTILMLAAGAASCTHYQGPSGDLYGRWQLERIEADGMEAPEQTGDLYWSFQTQVIYMQLDCGEHEFEESYGIFRMDDNTLFLDFPQLAPLKPSGLPRQSALQILRLTGKEMTLLYNPTDDSSLTYYFRKW